MAEVTRMLGRNGMSDGYFCPATGKRCPYDNGVKQRGWWTRASHKIRRKREDRQWRKEQT